MRSHTSSFFRKQIMIDKNLLAGYYEQGNPGYLRLLSVYL